MQPPVVVIDLGGTLADLHKIALAVLNDVSGGDYAVSRQAVLLAAASVSAHDFSYFFLDEAVIARLFPRAVNPLVMLTEYRRRALAKVADRSRVRLVFQRLMSHGALIVIATNGTDEATSALLTAFDVADLIPPDLVLTSQQFGCLKSAGKIHRAIRDRFLGRPIWGVGDDIVEDLWPAASTGMTPVWVTQYVEMQSSRESLPPGTVVLNSISDLPTVVFRP